MRYHLRTLVSLTAVGPPLLAGLYFSFLYLPPEAVRLAYVLVSAAIAAAAVATVIGSAFLLGWVFSRIAKRARRLLVQPARVVRVPIQAPHAADPAADRAACVVGRTVAAE